MELLDTYKTIQSKAEGYFKDKGSKFYAYAYPIRSEDAFKAHVQELKKEHHNARHHCYAYRIGIEGDIYRANDDGEPSGTAGKPILGQLMSYEVSNVLIVVVRYFGGTLLGVGGLINAYRQAAKSALENSTIVEKVVENYYTLQFDYPLQNAVSALLKKFDIETIDAKYEMNCELTIALRLSMEQTVLSHFDKTDGVKLIKK